MDAMQQKKFTRPGLNTCMRLRSGLTIPNMGLGSGSLRNRKGRDALVAALKAGYRLIDTALFYGTEENIAMAIRQAGLQREDVFIVTKLIQKCHASPAQIEKSLRNSLKNLRTNYVDLYLIHNPRAGRLLHVWPHMLQIRDRGSARAVGVSNFGIRPLEGLRKAGFEMPEVNQIELHCFLQHRTLVSYCRSHGIATMAHAPLARCRLLGKTVLRDIAKDVNRSEPELLIRWSLHKGHIPIPQSSKPARIRSNASNFDLTKNQLAAMDALDRGYMSCTVATPCMEISWDLIAKSIPTYAQWPRGLPVPPNLTDQNGEISSSIPQQAVDQLQRSEIKKSYVKYRQPIQNTNKSAFASALAAKKKKKQKKTKSKNTAREKMSAK